MNKSEKSQEGSILNAKDFELLSRVFDLEKSSDATMKIDKIAPIEGMNVLIQSSSMTYSVHNTTEFQENVLNEVVRCLQPYMTKDADKVLSIKNILSLSVILDLSQLSANYKSVSRVEKLLVDLEKVRFGFRFSIKSYVKPDGTVVPERHFERSGVLFIGHDREIGTYNYKVHINTLALPYLTYIGKYMNYTEFDYEICKSFRSAYCQRFYKYICDWAYNDEVVTKGYDEIRKLLALPASYTANKIKERVINPVAEKLNESKSKVKFVFEDYNSKTQRKTKPAKDTIVFYLQGKKVLGKCESKSRDRRVSSLVACLNTIADKARSGDVIMAANRFVDANIDTNLFNKFHYYNHRRLTGKIDEEQMRNTMLKIVREAPYNCDLRSDNHIRNCARLKVNMIKNVKK